MKIFSSPVASACGAGVSDIQDSRAAFAGDDLVAAFYFELICGRSDIKHAVQEPFTTSATAIPSRLR